MHTFIINQRHNWPIVASNVVQNVALIIDQICTFQCIIPVSDLSKYDQRGHASPIGYGFYPKPKSPLIILEYLYTIFYIESIDYLFINSNTYMYFR